MRRLATALSALGFLWALAATVYILSGGGHEGISTSFTLAGGQRELGRGGVSLVSAEGVWLVGLLSGLTLIAGMPLGVALSYPEGQRITTWGAGALLLGFSVTTAVTVGLFYVPCAVVLLAAASATGVPGRGRPSGTEGHRSTV